MAKPLFNTFELRTFVTFILASALIVGCTDEDDTPGVETSYSDASDSQTPLFTEISKSIGLANFSHITGAEGKMWLPETMSGAGGVLDYDLDGWPDVVLVRGARWENNDVPTLALYKNTAQKSFVETTNEAGLQNVRAFPMGVAIGDYDNDGDPDIFLTAVETNMLFRNDDGVFQEVGAQAGIADEKLWSTASMWIDADRDGWLDLFVGNYVEWAPDMYDYCTADGKLKSYCTPELYNGVPVNFYRNNGDGTFSNWSEKSGFAQSQGKTLGAAALDVNDDGWLDVVLANDTQRDELYINNGDGTFTEKGVVSGVAFDENGKARAGMGIETGVVDNQGRETIFVGNFAGEMIGVYRQTQGEFFADRAAASRIGRSSLRTLTFGMVLFDAELDGDLDLFTANGHITEQSEKAAQNAVTYRQPPHLFLNDGSGKFTDAAPDFEAMQVRAVGRGAATIDFDRDGDFDLMLGENGGPVYFFENHAANSGAHFLKVFVQGVTSNRDGYGTTLIAAVGAKKLHRRIRSGSSYLSHSESVALFGLGEATKADSLTVKWPTGEVQVFREIEADSEYKLVEGGNLEIVREVR